MSDEPTNCPHCNTNLLGAPIPKEYLIHCDSMYFKREIGVYDMARDRTVLFRCPDCGGEWDAV